MYRLDFTTFALCIFLKLQLVEIFSSFVNGTVGSRYSEDYGSRWKFTISWTLTFYFWIGFPWKLLELWIFLFSVSLFRELSVITWIPAQLDWKCVFLLITSVFGPESFYATVYKIDVWLFIPTVRKYLYHYREQVLEDLTKGEVRNRDLMLF